ncbi:MAG TPA: hypothetical protein VMZ52_17770 [Bryobacteraceae bacterium]|nr:hypothetical protein [Bryobacteraceae bacterium]
MSSAGVQARKSAGRGVTNSERATLSDGKFTHQAHLQFVDEHSTSFVTARGAELNFKDSYKFNIAAYRLDRIMDLNMIPVSVERVIGGRSAAVTWWVDDTAMTELDRKNRKLDAPDMDAWNRQMYCVRVFDQLIYNTDRNLGNLVIDKGWSMWMIDHTRAFRSQTKLLDAHNLVKIDRRMLSELQNLQEPVLKRELYPYVNDAEIKGLLKRRDLIVEFFKNEVARKGEGAVLVDLPARGVVNIPDPGEIRLTTH